MRYVDDGPGISFPICDFCECDGSGKQTQGEVFALGEKGICLTCLERLRSLLKVDR